MIERQSRVQRRQNVLARQGESDLVLLDPVSGRYFTLNEVGNRVWELCDGERTVADIVAILMAEFDAPAEEIEADVLELLTDLANEKLIVTSV